MYQRREPAAPVVGRPPKTDQEEAIVIHHNMYTRQVYPELKGGIRSAELAEGIRNHESGSDQGKENCPEGLGRLSDNRGLKADQHDRFHGRLAAFQPTRRSRWDWRTRGLPGGPSRPRPASPPPAGWSNREGRVRWRNPPAFSPVGGEEAELTAGGGPGVTRSAQQRRPRTGVRRLLFRSAASRAVPRAMAPKSVASLSSPNTTRA